MSFAVIAIIFLIVRLASDWNRERRMISELKLHPRPIDTDPSAPSIYSLIMDQAVERPEEPLDYSVFPDLPAEEGRSYFPGASDLITDRPRIPSPSGHAQILACIHAVRSRRITDWRTLELYVRDVDPYIHRERALRGIQLKKINKSVRELFREMAFGSADYTAVKWGITIGSIGASSEQIEELMELARHAELTVYICRSLLVEKKRLPGTSRYLTELMEITDGWGLFQVIHYIAETTDLIADPVVQSRMVVNGMGRGSYARRHLASLFMERFDLRSLFATAGNEPELAEGLVDMVEVLLLEPEAPGILGVDGEGEASLDRILALLEALPISINTARGLRAVCIALGIESLGWPSREERLNAVYERFITMLSPDILATAIRGNDRREDALRIILELGIEPMVPVALEDFRRHPDPMNIEVLGRLGEGEHLRLLFDALPDAGELARRAAVTPDMTIEQDLIESSGNYAAIMRHMGKLEGATPLARIKGAAVDFHPWVRAAAMTAMGSIQRWTLDNESRSLVQAGLEDSYEFVREAARETAAYHNLKVTIDGTSGLILSTDFGVSLN